MPLWTLTNPPTFRTDAIPTERGWQDPVTGELLVAIRQLDDKRNNKIDSIFQNLLLENGANLLTEQGDQYGRPMFILME
jgi:hypothetical protein